MPSLPALMGQALVKVMVTLIIKVFFFLLLSSCYMKPAGEQEKGVNNQKPASQFIAQGIYDGLKWFKSMGEIG